jgi:hypothetical protein
MELWMCSARGLFDHFPARHHARGVATNDSAGYQPLQIGSLLSRQEFNFQCRPYFSNTFIRRHLYKALRPRWSNLASLGFSFWPIIIPFPASSSISIIYRESAMSEIRKNPTGKVWQMQGERS